MNKVLTAVVMFTVMVSTACVNEKDGAIIGKQTPDTSKGIMTPEILWSFGRIGNVRISPDQKRMVYTVTYFSIPENKSNSEIFVMNVDGTQKKQLTHTSYRESSPKWMNDSQHVAFVSNESGSSQLWIVNADGDERKQITNREGGIVDFLFSPDEQRLLFIANVNLSNTTAELHPDLPKASGLIINDLMYKHWDEWVHAVPHPFVALFDGKSIRDEVDLLEGKPYESPVKPMGGIEQLAWSIDGSFVAYCSRKKQGKAYALSTNTDIYFYDIASGSTTNVTEGMMGYDMNPVFSPDGKWMAWESQERDGYESDKQRLFIKNLHTGEKRNLSVQFDQNAEALAWSNDSQWIYFVSVWHGVTQIYQANIHTGAITALTQGVHDYRSVHPTNQHLIAIKGSMSQPHEIYAVNPSTGEAVELSFENKHIMDHITMGKVEERWVTTTDNQSMLVWVIYPPHFDPTKKYPAILYCQGGPQSPVSQFWSYRWNMQTFAANGYIIVAPNRRGLPGFGTAWLEQISGDYGGQNMLDYLSAIDALAAEPYIDETRLGAVGASYGGFSVFWLAGNHNKRFKAFIAHAGIFNLEQQYLETEEMWFANWDMGGPFWDKQNEIAQRTYANSPHRFVGRWDTPILVTHGEKDYRILASQGMAAFNAAVLQGIPAQLLIYPDENHWILQPQNGILFQRTFANWLHRWLK